MPSTGQSYVSTHASRSRKPCRIVNRCLEGERCDRAHTRHGHEPAGLRITASQFCNLTVKFPDLLLDGVACFEQRPDRSYQLGPILDHSARTAKTLNVARPITRPRFLKRPRTWFSRSRLILTSSARLASSALTEWLSISLTCTSLNQPVCVMRAIPTASLRSLLLICILSTALAWRASMQITGRPSCLSSVHSHVAVGPVSRPIRTAPGAVDLT